jgi:hypothetical protein
MLDVTDFVLADLASTALDTVNLAEGVEREVFGATEDTVDFGAGVFAEAVGIDLSLFLLGFAAADLARA